MRTPYLHWEVLLFGIAVLIFSGLALAQGAAFLAQPVVDVEKRFQGMKFLVPPIPRSEDTNDIATLYQRMKALTAGCFALIIGLVAVDASLFLPCPSCR